MQLVKHLPLDIQAQGVYLHQFVLHAALDAVNEQLWTTTSMHLGNVDKFNNLMVAAHVTAAHVRFLLLHDGKSDEAIRLFFKDVYDVYVRVSFLTTSASYASWSCYCTATAPLTCAGLHEPLFHNCWAACISRIWSESPDPRQNSFSDVVRTIINMQQ